MVEQKASDRAVWLDIFKYFLAFLVICIHLAGESYWHFPVYRLAVPTFFMISGYFIRAESGEKSLAKAKGFIGRSLRYMAIGFAINIAFDIVWCYYEGVGVGYYFTTLFYENFLLEFFILNRSVSYWGAQLWFLIALFVVSLIHYALVRFQKTNWYKFLIPVCFFIYFFFSAFMHFFQDTDIPVRYMRNALFFGLPTFGFGYLLAGKNFHKKPWCKFLYLGLGVVFFFLQIGEHALLHTPNESLEMYVSGVISGACFLLSLSTFKSDKFGWFYKAVGKNGAFYIYVLHLSVAVLLSWFISFPNAIVKCLAVFAVSFLIYEIGFLISKALKKKK